MEKRIVFSDNSILSDHSIDLNKYKSGSAGITYVASEDKLFVGSRNPFNSFYVKLGENVNSTASVITVKYWNNENFVSAIDVQDETSSSGASLAQSGHVTFSTSEDYSWTREDTNNNGNEVTGLTDVVILNQYWLEVTFSQTLDLVDIEYIGTLFSNDNDLFSEFPIFNRPNIKAAFESGKTDWEEQHVVASEIIINDLMSQGIITHSGELLERERLKRASVSKVAELIFNSFGDDYTDDATRARNEYVKRLTAPILIIDTNKNARIDEYEETKKQGWLSR